MAEGDHGDLPGALPSPCSKLRILLQRPFTEEFDPWAWRKNGKGQPPVVCLEPESNAMQKPESIGIYRAVGKEPLGEL